MDAAAVTASDEHYELYSQLAAHTTNLQQLPQSSKRLQKLKKLKIREIQSLALEGGDTGRGYCSCDEQWTGSTSSSTSPSYSTSPLPTAAPAPAASPAPAGGGAPPSTPPSFSAHTQTLASTSTYTSPSTSTLLPTNINNSEAYEKTSETGSGTNDATGGSGYNRTNKQPCNGSTASTAAMTTSSLLKHHHHPLPASNDYGPKALITAVDDIHESSFVTLSTNATAVVGPGNIKTITLRRNPIATARLKQQHHVRFSDEKNFSD